jgi:hypothetical protein
MSTQSILAALTLKELGHLIGHLNGTEELKMPASKAKGQEKATALLAEQGMRLVEVGDSPRGYEVLPLPEGFVKATKEELGAMSKAERAAYRKARRKAARDRRKAA